MSKLFADIRARVDSNDNGTFTCREDRRLLLEAIDVMHLKLASSKNFMYFGLLEMTAHMGIPEHKRKSMIAEIESNYAHYVNEALERVRALSEGGEK